MNRHIEFVSCDRNGISSVITADAVIDSQTVIREIRDGLANFFVGPTAWDRVPVLARAAFGNDYLFANWDGTRRNNLHDLHDLRGSLPAPSCRH